MLFAAVLLLAGFVWLPPGACAGTGEPPRKKLVALTFDDGPSVYTIGILDVLEQYNAHATFCVMGERVEKHADTLRRAVSIGCEVIGHGWNHIPLPKLTSRDIREQLYRTQQAIADATGTMPPMMYRPPYLARNDRVIRISQEEGYMIVGWSFQSDGNRWAKRGASITRQIIANNVYDRSIILCHDIASSTRDAMTTVIPDLIDMGYELVTLSELLEAEGMSIVPGDIWAGAERPQRLE